MLLANLVTSMILFGSPSPAVSQSGETYRNNLNEVIARSLRSYDISSNGYTASQPGKFDFKVSSSARLHLNEISAAVTAFGNGNVSNLAGAATSRTSTDANGWPKLTFNRSNLSEWFVNERNGLHHWMQVNKKSGAGDLWVKLAVTTPEHFDRFPIVKLKSLERTELLATPVLRFGMLKAPISMLE